MGLVTGPHARTPRTLSQWVVGPGRTLERMRGRGLESARPWTPHTEARGAPPRAPSCRPHSAQSQRARARAVGLVTGPHAHTPAPTARGWRTPTARPVGGQFGEGERLTTDAPHNSGRHPPPGMPFRHPTASNAGPQGRTLWGRCWVPTPASTAPGTHGPRNPGSPLQRTGGRGRDSA